ncbi:MAG: enoyl-CoA hydratase/isomerase family protein [Chloroflexi bacterium]|nr:enoyl-CoA hydratase/isomerase family protein [Chloroflexota bacterium]
MEFHDVLYATDGPVATVTLNRPRYRNAQSYRLLDELDAALDRAVADHAIKVIIVTGAGDHFSAGHDLGTPESLEDRRQRGIPENAVDDYNTFRHYNLDLTIKWRNLPKPTIAMVRGYCIFGGWMIAAAVDLVFASPEAQFLPALLEYYSVPFDIGVRNAKEMLFESRFLSAEEAKAMGFVSRIYESDALERETLAYAMRCAENSRHGLRLAKLSSNKAQDLMGYSNFVENAFHDYLVAVRQAGEARRVEGVRRLGGVDLALRGARNERPGQ